SHCGTTPVTACSTHPLSTNKCKQQTATHPQIYTNAYTYTHTSPHSLSINTHLLSMSWGCAAWLRLETQTHTNRHTHKNRQSHTHTHTQAHTHTHTSCFDLQVSDFALSCLELFKMLIRWRQPNSVALVCTQAQIKTPHPKPQE